ncbi:MAG: Flp pilus assembly protein CpaB [Armatimonadetes bacterium]|nr:Flp pilus assembly protein CpaB [Armatimonadota bacterium]MDW8121840.1 Flp pilus assembly protein CpaB [Armatimonadota bacterium]
MQRRLLLPAGLVIVAVIATMVVMRMRGAGDQPQPVPEVPKAKIVVAARDLPPGQIITNEDVKEVELPVDKIPAGSLAGTEEAVGSLVLRTISREQPLRRDFVQIPPDKMRKFSVPIGRRAYVLYQGFTEGAIDVVLTGDTVDIIATRRRPLAGEEIFYAEVIVNRARVLLAEDYSPQRSQEERLRQQALAAAETRTPAPPEAQPSPQQPAQTQEPRAPVTQRRLILAVTPEEAVRLARAQEEGRVLTVLRSEADLMPVAGLSSPRTYRESVAAPSRPQPPRPARTPTPIVAPARPAVEPVHSVLVYRGTQREEVLVTR